MSDQQLRTQNQSLIATLNEIDEAILVIDANVEFELGSLERTLWAKLVSGARARDAANHAGDLIAGGKS